jgi:ribosome-associated protein
VVNCLEEKKAEDIILLDIQKENAFTDFFIICSATSDRMLRSLMHAVLEHVKKNYKIEARAEGITDSGWLAIDLIDIVIHIFSTEQRKYYQLEDLWKNGKVVLRVK